MGVRRFEHDFTPTAGPTLFDPARGKLRGAVCQEGTRLARPVETGPLFGGSDAEKVELGRPPA